MTRTTTRAETRTDRTRTAYSLSRPNRNTLALKDAAPDESISARRTRSLTTTTNMADSSFEPRHAPEAGRSGALDAAAPAECASATAAGGDEAGTQPAPVFPVFTPRPWSESPPKFWAAYNVPRVRDPSSYTSASTRTDLPAYRVPIPSSMDRVLEGLPEDIRREARRHLVVAAAAADTVRRTGWLA
eukprot:GHVU01227665.1.p1 GENE.GHVU01227665.1~~GHVU01227665.1.p1  ORF type:complete len:187 (-),score=14.47 GHVU01227665.1:78-638(-)